MTKIVEQNIISFIDRHNLIKNGDKLLIAFSGGADSLFALRFFYKYQKKYGITLGAFHVNHLLRGKEADDDEEFCNSVCKELNVQYHSVKVDVKKYATERKLSVEDAARTVRYRELENYATKHEFSKIVTAHNLNDNTETVLLNLFRGTGLNGASGIPVKRGIIIRPLLSVSKQDIVEYLDENNIKFRTDSSNLQNDYSRNFLRNEIIPQIRERINPAVDLNILKFSETAAESYQIVLEAAEDVISKHMEQSKNEIKIFDSVNSKFEQTKSAIAVKLIVEKTFGINLSFSDIVQIKKLFDLQTGSRFDLSENLSAIRERGFVLLFRKSRNESGETERILNLNEEVNANGKIIAAEEVDEATVSNDKNIEFIDGEKISFPLKIRKWQSGDKFTPLGLNGTKKVSDFLTELKIDASKKKEQLVVLSSGKIIWVVNERIDENVKINKNSKRIIKLWVK